MATIILYLTNARTSPISGRTYEVILRSTIKDVEPLERYIVQHPLYLAVAPDVTLHEVGPFGEDVLTVVGNHASSGEMPAHAFDGLDFGWRPADMLIDPDSQEDLHEDAAAALTAIGAVAAFSRQAGELSVVIRWVDQTIAA